MQELHSNKGATQVDRLARMKSRSLKNRCVVELIPIFTTQKYLQPYSKVTVPIRSVLWISFDAANTKAELILTLPIFYC